MFLIKPRKTQPHSIYARLTRLVFIIIVAAFFFLGLLAMFFVRSSMVADLTREQRNTLDRAALELSVALAAPVDDVSQLSKDRTAAELGAALARGDVVSLNAVKDELLGDFITLLQQHSGSYLEMRYIAPNGTMEARARALNDIAPDRNAYRGLFANDTTFRSTLSQPPAAWSSAR